ncbi:MAG: hypothetical protein IKD02_03760 [Clostridia bacterium]|nr:hypothetical protein [Clostridia bacterium]
MIILSKAPPFGRRIFSLIIPPRQGWILSLSLQNVKKWKKDKRQRRKKGEGQSKKGEKRSRFLRLLREKGHDEPSLFVILPEKRIFFKKTKKFLKKF